MGNEAVSAGERLKGIRRRLNMTMRDVHAATKRLAEKNFGNEELIITPSRLSAIERDAAVPSVYKLFSLSYVYEIDGDEILQWYGIELYPRVRRS